MSVFKDLQEEVFQANMMLPEHNIVYFTWGNVSVYSTELQAVAIKPSGVPYNALKRDDIVVTDIEGTVLHGALRPSSDLHTHLELYRNFKDIRAVVHTHSSWACGWAQAGEDIACLGTTHADCFYGSIPCTRALRDDEIAVDYELHTGRVIVKTFQGRSLDPLAVPGVLVKNHGPFAWGSTSKKAVEHAVTLEIVAKMNAIARIVNPRATSVDKGLLDKHYYRKHGKNAYYGQQP